MEEKFLSRKQKRKNSRKEKQEKKNSFYRQRYQKDQRKNSFNSNYSNSNKADSRKNSFDSSFHQYTSNRKDSKDKEDKLVYKSNKINKPKIISMNEVGSKVNHQQDHLEKEIEYLEKKLDLKSKEKVMLLNKKLTIENYDPDLLDFLDNIDTVINQDLISYDKPKQIKNKKEQIANDSSNINTAKSIKQTQKKTKKFIEANLNNDEDKPKSVLRKASLTQSDIEIQKKFNKDLTSIINKIAESNLSFLFPEFYSKIKAHPFGKKSLYETISSITLKLLLNQEITNLPITSCICSIISILHFRLGNNFLLYYIRSLFNEVASFSNSDIAKHKLKNAIFEIIHFYILGNITSMLIYDLIKFFIEHFNEAYSEFLLLLLSYTGIEIRKESPENLKDIITEINKKYNTMKIDNIGTETSKIKYIVDMIDDIKHNKYLKFNLSEKFNFFKTFVANQSNSDIKQGEKMEIALESISKYNLDDLCKDNSNGTNDEDPLMDNDILNAITNDDLPDDLFDESQTKLAEAKMKKLNISTQLKRTIFKAITNAYDINDAFERLTRLNLNKEQNRETIKIIIQLCYEERSFNPFYRCLIEKLMSVNKDHKYTYHYCIWDYMKVMHTFKANELKKIHNLAKLTSQLLADEKISLPVFLHYKFDEGDENTRIFIIFAFDFYFELSNVNKTKILFAKLVKNDEHVEFAQRLFQFLLKDFTNEIDVERKNEAFQDNMSAAIRVLNQIKPIGV